jgi:hypothetical protein
METVSAVVRTFWLSMHVPYACRHAGACCSSGWPIPVERERVAAISVLRHDRSWLRRVVDAPADVSGVLALSNAGHCVFHRRGCEIQHAFGHRALPTACQHFPRVVLIDPRGVSVTLSHYCPTAAELLFTHEGPVTIVEGPPVLPEGDPEGLDARDVLPPLLVAARASASSRHFASSVLMDWDGYRAWEEHMVHVLANAGLRPEIAIDRLERDLWKLQQWRPGTDSLRSRVRRIEEREPTLEREDSTEPITAGARR